MGERNKYKEYRQCFIGIWIGKELKDALKVRAKKDGLFMQNIVQALLEDFLMSGKEISVKKKLYYDVKKQVDQ